jgi:hypothetical protein
MLLGRTERSVHQERVDHAAATTAAATAAAAARADNSAAVQAATVLNVEQVYSSLR